MIRRTVIKASANSPTKLRVKFEPYDRYASTRLKTATVSGPTRLDALKKMVDKMGLYFTSEDIEEDEMTADEVIERLESENGDGCDFILTLEDLSTGEVLLDCSDWYEEDEEDWE